MLKIAAKHYLKSIGDKLFVANPDCAEWADCGCLDLVILRRPKWFWQKNIYSFDQFGLDEVLDSPLPTDRSALIKKPELLTPSFVWTSKHNIKGKIGGAVASLISLDLSTDDVMTVNVNFEDLMKQSIEFAAVAQLLATKKVNLRNRHIEHLARDSANVLCIVTQYIYIDKKTEIKISVDDSFQEKMDDTPALAKICKCWAHAFHKVKIDDAAGLKTENAKSIVFEAGTKLAFDFSELLIGPDGSIELIDRAENFSQKYMIPTGPRGADPPAYCAHITEEKQNYDIPDSHDEANLSDLVTSLDKMLINKSSKDITTNLLGLAIADKMTLKQLESFLLGCQRNYASGGGTVDLKAFNAKQLENTNIQTVLGQIGFNTKNSQNAINASQLNIDVINAILIKIHSIYHLEAPYWENLYNILLYCDPTLVVTLYTYLQDLRKPTLPANSVFENLIKNSGIKLLLLSIGITENKRQWNHYFEPTLILLQGT